MNTPLSNSFIPSSSFRPEFNLTDEKPFNSGFTDTASKPGGGNTVDFGQLGSSGTPMDALSGEQANGTGNGQSSDMSQVMSQIMSEIMKAILPLLQQLLQGQQGGNEAPAAGVQGGGGNAGAGNAGAGEAGAGETPATVNAPAENTPVMPVLSDAETQQAGQSSPTSNSSPALSTSSGGDLHLPDSLKNYESDIQHAAQSTGVPANVLAAQIWQESRGNLGASTVNGGNGLQDAGLMQVNSNTFADLQSKNPDLLGADANPNNPRDNIMSGALYMKEQLNAFDGNMGAALRAYNSGPNNVNTNDLSDISKTGTGDSTYVDKVMDFANTIATGKGTLPA